MMPGGGMGAMAGFPVQQHMQAAAGLPVAALSGWTNLWFDGIRFWHRLYEVQSGLLRRQTEFVRSHNHIARGPDWMDHYGRRTRDVNVERV